MADNKVNSGLLEFSEDQKVFVALDAETSEVKKAVTIDEDGVETDMLGVQPTGKKEITSTAEVNVASYATAQVVDEDLVAGNIKKDVDILGVVGSYEPEAPASDFSTAELTLQITSARTDAVIIIPSVITTPMDAIANDLYNPTTAGTQQVITVPLYKGSLVINGMWDNEVTVNTSGNVQVMDRSFLITGDCAITIA